MLSSAQVAERVGVNPLTVGRFCHRQGIQVERGPGRGWRRFRLSAIDVMVLRADLAIRHDHTPSLFHRALELTAAVIRSHPRRWLLLTNNHGQITATTHDTAEAAGPAWLSRGGVAWLIDLIPEAGT